MAHTAQAVSRSCFILIPKSTVTRYITGGTGMADTACKDDVLLLYVSAPAYLSGKV